MRWLVDGYNVIRGDPDLRGAEARGLAEGRRALLALVAAAVRRTGDRFVVVFDGAPVPGLGAAAGQVQVVFSRPPQTADDVLVRLAHEAREGAIVVTSDRTVQNAARRAGCVVLASDDFVRRLDASAGGGVANDDEDDAERAQPKRGNPRRLSKDERAKQRALRRLGGR